jgi:HEAT repeat protein
MKTKFIYLILALLISFQSRSQINRTTETIVADILAQMPTDDLKHRDRVMAEMITLGEKGLELVTDGVVPPGTGDDTEVRFALNGLVRYASAFGRVEEKAVAESAFLKALAKATDKEVKAFFIHQLKLVAEDKSVEAVSDYLQDERLGAPAVQLIMTVASPNAEKQLINALTSAKGENQVAIVKGLGDLKSKTAYSTIAVLVGSSDSNLQRVLLYAMANIADPAAASALLSAAKEAGYNYEGTNAVGALTLYADRLGETGQDDLMKKVCKTIIKSSKTTAQLHNKATALSILSKYFGHEVTAELLKSIDNPDKSFRNSILKTAEKVGGVADTKAWIKRSKKLSPTIQSDLLLMLGKRQDISAIPYVKTSLNSGSAEVRKSSITAITELLGSDAVNILLTQVQKTTSQDELTHLEKTLLTISDDKHLAPFVSLFDNSSASTKVVAINVIAAKSGSQAFDKVFSYTNDNDATLQEAAFKALKRISTEINVEQLIDLLFSVDDDFKIDEIQKALVSAVNGIELLDEKSKPFLTALNSNGRKERIVKILPELGGAKALNAVKDLFDKGIGIDKQAAFDALVNWKSHDASNILYNICKTDNGSFKSKAFNGFVKQVASSDLPDDQKLFLFSNIMAYASTDDQRINIIKSLSRIKTFMSFIYMSHFLDNKALQADAGVTAMRIALPSNGQKVGLYGEIVRKGLEKAEKVIGGADSEYYKIDIRNYLEAMPKDIGFIPMFNGKDLTGWKGLVGNPISRMKMSAKELAKKQKEADLKMLENWGVKDGMIVFNGHGANMSSIKDYDDFELVLDWRISKDGDSGIYLRGTPQVQIWDTSRIDVGAQVGSGGLYNNNPHQSKPLKVTDNPIGEWNTFRITMIGEKVTVYSNGVLVVDDVTMDNYWDRKLPIFPSGPIELQAHGTDLAFRNIYVREIEAGEYKLSPDEKADGFVSLFNGSNLDGWQGNKTDYYVENGEIVVQPKRGGHGNLFTEKEYSDFNYRFEFQLTPGANNGLGIRAPLEGDAAYVGMELQILDNTAPIYANLKEYQYHGSVYGVIPAKRGYQNPIGEWNTEEVIVKGSQVKVILNGTVIVNGNIKEASKNGTLDHKDHPGLKRNKGYIGFLGHGSELKFRNIRIKDLRE